MIEELGIHLGRHEIMLIAGPTASGKSGLAIEVAKRHGGIIINADSLQVYECWRILTSRPTPEDELEIPHYLYGHVSCHEPYSISRWLEEINHLLNKFKDELKIIVGGTGMYFTVLTSGFASIPGIKDTIKEQGSKLLHEEGIERLLDDLRKNDPTTFANLDKQNPRRVQRAWEVFHSTGIGLATWFRYNQVPLVRIGEAKAIVLDTKKDKLEKNIKKRLELMVKAGVLDECRNNLSILNKNCSAAKAIGAKELIDHLKGKSTLDEAKYKTMVATRQYAKRQRTWFRNKMEGWEWVKAD